MDSIVGSIAGVAVPELVLGSLARGPSGSAGWDSCLSDSSDECSVRKRAIQLSSMKGSDLESLQEFWNVRSWMA